MHQLKKIMNTARPKPSEPLEQVETLSELLRIGKDEMNLAEFPMTSLSDKPVPGETSLKFEDQIYDDRKKKVITRKRVIEGSKEYGLPTATDDAVILALIRLTQIKNAFTSRDVEFTRHELINLLHWPNKGQSYDRIAHSLHRVAGVTYHFENSWWDNRRKAWTTKIFGIIDNVDLNDSRETDGQGALFTSKVTWNQTILDSFQAGYLRSLDFRLAMSFKHAISLRIYRFMGKRFHLRPEWTFDLKDFAYEHIGLSRNYEGGTQIARKLNPALGELEAADFLEPLDPKDRFIKKGRDWSIRLVQKARTLPAPVNAPAAAEADPPLAAELVKRGVTRAAAIDLVQQHPAEKIAVKIEVFDWLAEKCDKRIEKSPAGYLVKSITDDYAMPKGFIGRAERRARDEARQAKERQAAEERRSKQKEEARELALRKAVNAHWESLTPEQQAELDAVMDAQADPETLANEQGSLEDTFRRLPPPCLYPAVARRQSRCLALSHPDFRCRHAALLAAGCSRTPLRCGRLRRLPAASFRPLVHVGTGRLPRQTCGLSWHPLIRSPGGGRFAPPVVCFCSDRPQTTLGGRSGKRDWSGGRDTRRFVFRSPFRP